MAVNLPERLQKYRYLTHVIVALGAGVGLIYAASRVKQHDTAHDVLNEFGIAIVIAAIVTLMYETYAREVLASETMAKVVETVMGDMFDTQLWEEMRTQLLRRTAVRRGFSMRIRLERDAALKPDQAVLWMSVAYRLHALRAKTEQVRVYHYLDRFMRDESLDLPRFTHISVGDEVIDPRSLPGNFERTVDVRGWPDGVPVIVERKEIVYTPGAYNFIMSELTAVELIRVEDVPSDVAVEVNWTLDKPHPMTPYEACAVKRMLLPGHSVELRFNRRDVAAGATVNAA